MGGGLFHNCHSAESRGLNLEEVERTGNGASFYSRNNMLGKGE